MELDPIGKYQAWKLRKDQAKDLKTVRKTSNKLMSGLPGHRNTAYDLAQDAAKKTREEAIKKIKEGSKKRIKIGKKAAVVGTLVGGGYALNKLMKDEKLYSLILTESQLQRLYSKIEESKKEEYLNGKETKHQENSRKKLTGSLVGLSTALGAEIGLGTAKNKNFERALKIAKNANEDSDKVVGALEKMVTKFKEKGSRFKDQQSKDAFEGALKWGDQRVNNNIKGVNKAFKVAKAMDTKAALKRGLKGAAIGTAVLAPLAYAANKSIKNRNEEINRSRRGKNKK